MRRWSDVSASQMCDGAIPRQSFGWGRWALGGGGQELTIGVRRQSDVSASEMCVTLPFHAEV